jgi:aminoglycoside phosphotransferase (APT) family kinase protein
MSVFQEDQAFEQLVQRIAPHSRLLRRWPLSGGISAAMMALEIERPGGGRERLIARRPGAAALQHNPRAAQEEFWLLELLQAAGLATPAPYYLDAAGELFGAPCLAIEYIEGQPRYAFSPGSDFTLQLAAQLASIHSVDRWRLDPKLLPTQAKGLARTLARPPSLNTSMNEGRIRAVLEAAWPPPQRNAPALLHGDFWPGNILWRDNRLVAVVDWEDVALADPLIDLAIARLDLVWIFGVEAMHSFTERYMSRMALDRSSLPYWDLYAALRLIRLAGADLAGWAAFFTPYGRPDITEHSIREHYQYFVGQALAAL